MLGDGDLLVFGEPRGALLRFVAERARALLDLLDGGGALALRLGGGAPCPRARNPARPFPAPVGAFPAAGFAVHVLRHVFLLELRSAKERKDSQDDNYQADQVDKAVHRQAPYRDFDDNQHGSAESVPVRAPIFCFSFPAITVEERSSAVVSSAPASYFPTTRARTPWRRGHAVGEKLGLTKAQRSPPPDG